ncbi:MAG: hypothetical protein NTU53_18855 [Planctomycetota bacterium]|nr:hypothetical protein [Planctomycetota bacterium]
MTRRWIILTLAAGSAIVLCNGCGSSSQAPAVGATGYNFSPGQPVVLSSGDAIGRRMHATQRSGLADNGSEATVSIRP